MRRGFSGYQFKAAQLSAQAIACIKSLLTFAHKLGLMPLNVGLPVRQPKAKDAINERILSELQVQSMICLETEPRNRAILRLLYNGGLRVSELCALKWRDLNSRGDSGSGGDKRP